MLDAKKGRDHGRTWRLIDPRPLQAECPYTFFLPSHRAISALKPGDIVKLMFDPVDDHAAIERMWVEYHGADAKGLYGRLDNQPFGIEGLSATDPIRFKPWHIIALWDYRIEDEDGDDHQDRMFARCRVDPRVLSGEVRIGAIERRKPRARWLFGPPEVKGVHDSHWFIYGDDGQRPADRNMSFVAVGTVLNRDDSFLPYLEAQMGTRLTRDGGNYVDA